MHAKYVLFVLLVCGYVAYGIIQEVLYVCGTCMNICDCVYDHCVQYCPFFLSVH